jgi:hypothetical protein
MALELSLVRRNIDVIQITEDTVMYLISIAFVVGTAMLLVATIVDPR